MSKTIFIDSDCKCHITDDGTMIAINTEHFDGKCDAFIEGYRFVPDDKTWTRSDGSVFQGKMIAPWKDYKELEAAQAQYETDMADLQTAYQEGVNSI